MNTQQKQVILAAVEAEIERLGSAAKVATKVGLNDAYISMMRNGKWNGTLKDEHWHQVAQILGVSLSGWQMVDITNTRIIYQVLSDAKNGSMFMAVSNFAGSGKTAACRSYSEANSTMGAYYFQVEHGDMNRGDFLRRLANALGIDTRGAGPQYQSSSRLADAIIEFFVKRFDQRPLLIIDEADKLTDKAKRFFISLYNAVEGRMGCVILGTDNLEKQIKRGVQFATNGMDEIDSRFGRRFIHLRGVTSKECNEICKANGITDPEVQKAIFNECEPVSAMNGAGRTERVIKDIRPLRRKIERELLKLEPVEAVAS